MEQPKRRFRYLFRRNNRSQDLPLKLDRDLPSITSMTEEDKKIELAIRFEVLMKTTSSYSIASGIERSVVIKKPPKILFKR